MSNIKKPLTGEERILAERMQKCRDDVLRQVLQFDGADQPLIILEFAIVEVIRQRCRGFMAKALELVSTRLEEKLRKRARR